YPTLFRSDGKFDHSTTGFPLQGPHMLPPRTTVTGAIGPMVNACTDCHTGGNYTAGYPTMDCYGCHQTYYTNAQTYGATVPNHITASYPTACVSCHTTYATTAWMGAVFNHTFFRIPHNGSVCSDFVRRTSSGAVNRLNYWGKRVRVRFDESRARRHGYLAPRSHASSGILPYGRMAGQGRRTGSRGGHACSCQALYAAKR